MTITNYKLKDFLKLPTEEVVEYTNLLKYLKPVETKHKLHELSLRQVETIRQGINDPNNFPEVFKYIQDLDENELNNLKIIEFYGLFNSVIKQIENLTRMEQQELISEHTDHKWEAVQGSKRLSKLGILPMVDNLAQGDILKYDQILDLPYLTVFNHLRLKRIQQDIEHDMSKIKSIKG